MHPISSKGFIKVENASYNWGFRLQANTSQNSRTKLNIQNDVDDQDVLSEVNFELKSGDLMIVVGSVGSGKTSLLHALMNETNRTGGTQIVKGKIAYVE